MTAACSVCGASGVRLYRPLAGNGPVVCNRCVQQDVRRWFVPLLLGADGKALSLEAAPPGACAAWFALAEADEGAPGWEEGGWRE